MASTYSLWLARPDGTRLALIDSASSQASATGGWLTLDYALSANQVGTLVMTLQGTFPMSYLQRDFRLEVWRSIDGGIEYLDAEAVWFIRKTEEILTERGEYLIVVTALSALYLTTSRDIDYNTGTSQANQSAASDNVAKAIIRDNMGSTATDTTRSLASYLTVAADAGLGPTIAKALSRRKVLDALQEVAQKSAAAGTPLYFDIVGIPGASTTALEFRTYPTLRGLDHSFPLGLNPVIFDPDRNNLTNCHLVRDYTGEITYARALGPGQGDNRQTATQSDSARLAASPFNRRELVVEASSASSASELQSEADAAVRAGRPIRTFSGTILDSPGTRYGLHWRWGDKVTASYRGQTFDCRIDGIKVSVKAEKETITAGIRLED